MATRNEVMDALIALALTCAGVDVAQKGAPENLPQANRVFHISVIDSPRSPTPVGRDTLTQNYLCVWETAVRADEGRTEADLADFLDDWHPKFIAAQQGGGPLAGATWDNTLAAAPDYRPVAEVEGRSYPFIVSTRISLPRFP
jgi:hypothetical protein